MNKTNFDSINEDLMSLMQEGMSYTSNYKSNGHKQWMDRLTDWEIKVEGFLSKKISSEQAKKFLLSKGVLHTIPELQFKNRAHARIAFLKKLRDKIVEDPDIWVRTSVKSKRSLEDTGLPPIKIEGSTPIEKVKSLCQGFHAAMKRLQSSSENKDRYKIKDEFTLRYYLNEYLKGIFHNIKMEEWTVIEQRSARIDLVLVDEGIVIETKLTRSHIGEKEITDQLMFDIEKYKAHPDCKSLFCFVYDRKGYIKNPHALENFLSAPKGKLNVEVLIEPKRH